MKTNIVRSLAVLLTLAALGYMSLSMKRAEAAESAPGAGHGTMLLQNETVEQSSVTVPAAEAEESGGCCGSMGT